jgi:hypothetical protein
MVTAKNCVSCASCSDAISSKGTCHACSVLWKLVSHWLAWTWREGSAL